MRFRKTFGIIMTTALLISTYSNGLEVLAQELGKIEDVEVYGENKDYQPVENYRHEEPLKAEEDQSLTRINKVYETNYFSTYSEDAEVLDRRTSTSKTFIQSDGTYVEEIYTEPIHVLNSEGEFVEINNNLNATRTFSGGKKVSNQRSPFKYVSDNDGFNITNELNNTIRITPEGNLEEYSINQNTEYISNLYKNIDLEYKLVGNGVFLNYYFNGIPEIEEISFSVNYNGMNYKINDDSVVFYKGEVEQFRIHYSMFSDEQNISIKTEVKVKEINNELLLKIPIDRSWFESDDRNFPVVYSARALDETIELKINSSYIRSKQPYVTSQYYDLFVGHDDGSLNTINDLGITRTYIHLDDLKIGKNKIVTKAELLLHKKIAISNSWDTIIVSKTKTYVDPAGVNWNNKPSSLDKVSELTLSYGAGTKYFDITSYAQDIYKGQNKTLELKASNESFDYLANVFYGESGDIRPSVKITYRDDYDVNPDLPINTFDTELRLFSKQDDIYYGMSFDGIAKPNSDVFFDLVKKDTNQIINSQKSNAKANNYFINPIFIKNPIPNTQTYKKDNANYSTNYILANEIPEFDIPYEYKVRVVNNGVTSSKNFITDSFIKYKVKSADNLQTISSYYGIEVETIKKDNNLTKNTVKEDDVLILRFKKDNPKVSKDVYTPPLKTVEYKAEYVDRGPRCHGVCEVLDPINSSTGNYFAEREDFKLIDFNELSFTRYYNSTGPQLSGIFGNGFSTLYESYISYDKQGNILFIKGDGKIFKIDKKGNSYVARDEDRIEITVNNDLISINDLDSNETYVFNKFGMLDTIKASNNKETKLKYDDYGLLIAIKHGEKELKLTYKDKNLVTRVELPSTLSFTYKYDDKRNLIEVIDPTGISEKYEYSGLLLSKIINKNGTDSAVNKYDNKGRVISQIDENGNETILEYDHNETMIKYPNNKVETYQTNDAGKLIVSDTDSEFGERFEYNQDNKIIKKTNKNNEEMSYEYTNGFVSKITNYDNTFEEYVRDVKGNILSHRDVDGSTTYRTYDNNNNVLSLKDEDGTSTYKYDSNSMLIQEEDNKGNTKTYSYVGNQVSKIVNSNGLVEEFSYNKNGYVLSKIDNLDLQNKYVYDDLDRVVQINYKDSSSEQYTYDHESNISSYKNRIGGIVNYTYDKKGNLINTMFKDMKETKEYDSLNRLSSETNIDGSVIEYEYDALNRVISEKNEYGDKTTYKYDVNNNVISLTDHFGNTTLHEYDGNNLISTLNYNGLKESYEYDSLNRLTHKILTNDKEEYFTYDENKIVEEIDQYGVKTLYEYDTYNRIVKELVQLPDGSQQVNTYTFDSFDNVLEENINGVKTSFEYDQYNREISRRDGEGNTSYIYYDENGYISKKVDARGFEVSTEYDSVGNEISKTDQNGNIKTIQFNKYSQKISETDVKGLVTSFTYDENGKVSEVHYPNSLIETYKYNSNGNLEEKRLGNVVSERNKYNEHGLLVEKETLESHEVYEYDNYSNVIVKENVLTGLLETSEYDLYNNVVRVSDSEGLEKLYEYDEYGRLTSFVDEYNRQSLTMYNENHLISKSIDLEGNQTNYEYDVNGNVLTETVNDNTIKYTYDTLNRVKTKNNGKVTLSLEYNETNQVIKEEEELTGRVKESSFDGLGNLISSTDERGYVTSYGYDSYSNQMEKTYPNGVVESKEYDFMGNLVSETNGLGDTKYYEYNQYGLVEKEIDEKGFSVQYEYSENLLLVKEIDKRNNVINYEYDKTRKIAKVTNPLNQSEYFEYDIYGNEIKHTKLDGLIEEKEYNALNQITQVKIQDDITKYSYTSFGLEESKEINGRKVYQNKYDDKNRLVEQIDANGNKELYTYDEFDRVVQYDNKGIINSYEYDVHDNLIIENKENEVITLNEYDNSNNLLSVKINNIKVNENKYDEVGNIVEEITDGVKKQFIYDNLNQVVEVKMLNDEDIFSAVLKVTYDEVGNVLTETTANEAMNQKEYDAYSNLVKEVDPLGNENKYEYDALNNLIKSQNADERYVTYEYNKSGHVISKKIGEKYAEYKYDFKGNLLESKDEYGFTNKYTYDKWDNVVNHYKPSGQEIRYKYDANGNVLEKNKDRFTYNRHNQVLTAKNKEGVITYTYDDLGRVDTVKDTLNQTVKYTYDERDNVTSKKYGDTTLQYTYVDNKLKNVLKNNKEIASYKYNNVGLQSEVNQLGVKTQKEYDESGRLIKQVTLNKDNSVLDLRYEYDLNDNVVNERVNGKDNKFKYDKLDELIFSEKHINGELVKTEYSVDFYGNKVIKSNHGIQKLVYNNKNQISESINNGVKTTYQYNADGDVVRKSSKDLREYFEYDEFGKLDKLVQNNMVHDYTYDAEGDRFKVTSTDTNDYFFDTWYNYYTDLNLGAVYQEDTSSSFENIRNQIRILEGNNGSCLVDNDDFYTTQYNLEPKVEEFLIDKNLEYSEILLANDQEYIYGNELLYSGSDKTILNKTGSVVAEIGDKVTLNEYSDYGLSNSTSKVSYNSEQRDSTDYIYLRARYYDPEVGSFLQLDNNYLGEKESVISQNRYTYAINNPYKYIDKSGNLFLAIGIGLTLKELLLAGALIATALYLATPKGQETTKKFATSASNSISNWASKANTVQEPSIPRWGDTWGLSKEVPASKRIRYDVLDALFCSSAVSLAVKKEKTKKKKVPPAPKEEKEEKVEEGTGKAPEYPKGDGTVSPGEGWEWRGQGGPETGNGNWYNPSTGESLHPDLNHPEPIGPHWDWKDSNGDWWRIFPDGSLKPK